MLIGGSGTTALIGKACSPTSVLYVIRHLHPGENVRQAAVEKLGKSFFFITLDSAFGPPSKHR